jgi:hypothetical protein
MMFAVCDPRLNRETHVTLILRSLYLLFHEGYHGSNLHDPLRPPAFRLAGPENLPAM